VPIAAACLPALWHVWALIRLWRVQVPYPMDLEWMEGGALYHAWRFVHGQPIYGPPSQGFVPYPYPPLHFLGLAAVGSVAGFGYTAARLFSVACTIVAVVVLSRELWAHAKHRWIGAWLVVIGAGMVGASIPVLQGWYALIRNDALALVLPIVAASLCLAEKPSRARMLAIAGLLTASVYTKQTGVFFAAWIVLFLTLRNWRAGVTVAGAALIASILILNLLQFTSAGWFLRYMFLQANHQIIEARVPLGLWDITKTAPYLVVVPVAAAFLWGRGKLSRRTVLWTGMLVAAFPATLLPYMKAGGSSNNLIPIVFLAGPVALMLAIDVASLWERSPLRSLGTQAVLAVLIGLVLTWRTGFNPLGQAPSQELRGNAIQLRAWVASLSERGMVLDHPMLAIQTGKTSEQLHSMGIRDAADGRLPGINTAAFLRATQPDWIVVDQGWMDDGVRSAVNRYYQQTGTPPVSLRMPIATDLSPARLFQKKPPRLGAYTLFDFEQDTFDRWEISGTAFDQGPTVGLLKHQGLMRGFEGNKLANSYTKVDGDRATGEAVSPPFTIDRGFMSLLVGGGKGPDVCVELRADGKAVQRASGEESEALYEVIWSVGEYRGKEGRIALVDHSTVGWGHILADEIELFDLATEAAR
jgi:hypothetical protein